MKSFNFELITELLELEEQGEEGLIDDLIGAFRESSAQQLINILSELEKAERGDGSLRKLEMEAHSLKSSSRLLGLEEVSHIAYQIEEQARDHVLNTAAIKALQPSLNLALNNLTTFQLSRNRKQK